jgi:hypothetical protein
MKRHLNNIVLAAGLSVLLGSSTLSAQSQKAVASIPFAYHVGQQTFSPGKYAVGQTRAPGVFALRETATGQEIFMPVVQQSTGDKDAWNLTFSCYVDLPPVLRQMVKTQNSSNGELSQWDCLAGSSRKSSS